MGRKRGPKRSKRAGSAGSAAGGRGGRLRMVGVVAVLLGVGILVGSATAQFLASPAPATPPGPVPPTERIRVEVLNGGGLAGAARAATDRLRDGGFDVVFFGNAPTFGRDSSVVLARTDDLAGARAVADHLGIRNVRAEPDANLFLDVSVVLGTDWVPDASGSGGEEEAGRWWDPRGWLGR